LSAEDGALAKPTVIGHFCTRPLRSASRTRTEKSNSRWGRCCLSAEDGALAKPTVIVVAGLRFAPSSSRAIPTGVVIVSDTWTTSSRVESS
jgi:hypothetical protein